jgi:hypothetical protein
MSNIGFPSQTADAIHNCKEFGRRAQESGISRAILKGIGDEHSSRPDPTLGRLDGLCPHRQFRDIDVKVSGRCHSDELGKGLDRNPSTRAPGSAVNQNGVLQRTGQVNPLDFDQQNIADLNKS